MRTRSDLCAALVLVLPLAAACRDAAVDRGDAGARDDAGVPDASGAPLDLASMFEPDGGVLTVPLGGCYSTRLVPVIIGGQSFQLFLDTGATTLGVASNACTACKQGGADALYTPGPQAKDLMKPESSEFGDSSANGGWSGEAYQDLVSIGGLSTELDFVAIDEENSEFDPTQCDTPTGYVPGAWDGTIGFGSDDVLLPGTTSYLHQVQKAGKIADAFALSFCHLNGTLWLGGYDPSALAAQPQFVPLTVEYGYNVGWKSVSVARGVASADGGTGEDADGGTGEDADGGTGTTISLPADTLAYTDSGGLGWILPDATFKSLVAAIGDDPSFQAMFGASFFTSGAETETNCVTSNMTPAELDAALPELTLELGDATHDARVTLPATDSYLFYSYANGQTTYCQALADGASAGTSDDFYYVGESFMLDHVLIVDLAHQRMGFAERAQACPF